MDRYSFVMVFALILTLSIWGCEERVIEGEATPPEPPVLLPNPPDSLASEHGIDAIPENDYIRLEWLLNEEEGLAGYKIYRTTSPENLGFDEPIKTIAKGLVQGDTTYGYWDDQSVADSLLTRGPLRFYYTMTAYDEAGNESAFSDTVDYMLLDKISYIDSPVSEINTSVPEFVWEPDDDPIGYIIKVYDLDTNEKIWFSEILSATPYDTLHSVSYGGTDSLISGRWYKWRLDALGAFTNSGSESNWREFVYIPP